jgi:nucleoside transporter
MASVHPWIRTRLWVMMLLEFLLWGSWYVPVGGYMNGTLRFTGPQIGWIYATTALGAIISPLFVGYIADRFFATQRVLAVLHFIGGACLLACAHQTTFPALMTLLVINALCFMPTLALVNSISFRNIDDPNRFSRIAVGGTIGWIISGLVVDFLLGGSAKPTFFYLAGGGAVAIGAYCLTLPHTPPKGTGSGDVLGLDALKLLKEPSFLVFSVCAFLISISLSFYNMWCNAFLAETGSPWPTALQTLCQFSEIVVMLVMPWFIARIGLKNVLVVGMAAWAIRYAAFATLSFPLIVFGLLMHGFCYCFVFVAAFIYIGRKAPPEISASAQSFVAFLTLGMGMLVGTQLSGYTAQQYPPPVSLTAYKDGRELKEHLLPPWNWTETDKETGKEMSVALPQRAFGLKKGDSLALGYLEREMPDKVHFDDVTYDKKSLLAALKKADLNGNGVITREEWLAARSHVWPPIWLWPGGLAAVVCLLFLLGGRDVTSTKS